MKTLQRCCVDCPAALLCMAHKIDSVVRSELGSCRCWRLLGTGLNLSWSTTRFKDSWPPAECPILKNIDMGDCGVCIVIRDLKVELEEKRRNEDLKVELEKKL